MRLQSGNTRCGMCTYVGTLRKWPLIEVISACAHLQRCSGVLRNGWMLKSDGCSREKR